MIVKSIISCYIFGLVNLYWMDWLLVKRVKWWYGQNAACSKSWVLLVQTLVCCWETNGGSLYSWGFCFIYSFVHVYCLNISVLILNKNRWHQWTTKMWSTIAFASVLQRPVAYQILCDRIMCFLFGSLWWTVYLFLWDLWLNFTESYTLAFYYMYYVGGSWTSVIAHRIRTIPELNLRIETFCRQAQKT